MHWLITVSADATFEQLQAVLDKLGCQLPDEAALMPLDGTEQVISIKGPEDLPEQAEAETLILQVYPDSSMELY